MKGMGSEKECKVNVKTWKNDVVGDGSSDKDKVKSMAVKIFGDSVNKFSQDSVPLDAPTLR